MSPEKIKKATKAKTSPKKAARPPAPKTARAVKAKSAKETRPSVPKGNGAEAWVVTADMGLGHQRAAFPLAEFAHEGIMTVGKAENTPPAEHKQWVRMRKSYEFLSRTKGWPIIGNALFGMLDKLQYIPAGYPFRDMSYPSFQVNYLTKLIKSGMCGAMMNKIHEHPLPLLTSFYTPALAADRAGYSQIYCVICDAEVNRAWVAENPRKSRIVYLAPCGRTVRRLKMYGVPDERIWLTGFPLPKKLLGSRNLEVLKWDVAQRLFYLDPQNRFWPLHGRNVEYFLGRKNCTFARDRVLTITFGVGGAGAQTDIAYSIARSLRDKISHGEVRLNILAGTRHEVAAYLESIKRELGCPQIRIIGGGTLADYFEGFTDCMRTTDILWTKPSELSFYCGLGIPIVMAPAIGSQEHFNQSWLMEIQAGFPQEDPKYTDQWMFDLLNEGRLAESAWDGFLKARKYGTYKIQEVLQSGTMERETSVLKR